MNEKETKAATQKQADAVAEAQLLAMLGETIESAAEIVKEKEQKPNKES